MAMELIIETEPVEMYSLADLDELERETEDTSIERLAIADSDVRELVADTADPTADGPTCSEEQ